MFLSSYGAAHADIVVAYPSNFPPYYVLNGQGETVGFGLEVIKAVSERTGLKFRYVRTDGQDAIFNMLRTGRAQIVPGISMSDDAAKNSLFTTPIDRTDISIVTLKGSRIHRWSDLSGKTATATTHSRACVMLRSDPSIHAECTDEFDDMIYSLFSGNTDAVIIPYDSIARILQNMNIDDKVRIVAPPVYTEQRAIAVSMKDPELYKKINATLDDYMKTDEYKQLYDKWHQKPAFHINPSAKLHLAMIIFAAAVMAMLVWRYISLRRINRGLVATIS